LAARLLAARSEHGLDGSEGPLIVLGTLGAIVTPFVLWIRWVARTVWGNSFRAVALARRLIAVIGSAAVAYVGVGLLSIVLALGLGDPDALAIRLPTEALALAAATIVGLLAARAAKNPVSSTGTTTTSAISPTQF
jgi:hypothetical protein